MRPGSFHLETNCSSGGTRQGLYQNSVYVQVNLVRWYEFQDFFFFFGCFKTGYDIYMVVGFIYRLGY